MSRKDNNRRRKPTLPKFRHEIESAGPPHVLIYRKTTGLQQIGVVQQRLGIAISAHEESVDFKGEFECEWRTAGSSAATPTTATVDSYLARV
jgi:hypothetical protein